MASIRNIARGLQSLFRKEQVEQELSEEIGIFAEMAAQEKMKRGLSREEALRAVRLESGTVEIAREEVRSATWESYVEDVWRDFRFSVRSLRKSPGFSAIVILTLALGIAANTTVLSWISATLLNPIPGAARTSDLVTIDRGDRDGYATPPFSYPDLRDLTQQTQAFSGILGYHNDYMSLTGVAKPERIFGALTTASYFDVLGVRPILGRTFLPEEGTPNAGAAVIVIGYAVWQNHFGGDPQIVGKTIQINRHPYTVIGVTPRAFTGCATGLRTEMWIPLPMDRDVWGANRPEYRADVWLNAIGKLRAGVTKDQAEAELNGLMQGIVERFPEDHRDRSNEISLDPLWRSRFGLNGFLYKVLPMLLGLGGGAASAGMRQRCQSSVGAFGRTPP
jgi:putative ABC transport system permease protein